jgi:hypothetical protein
MTWKKGNTFLVGLPPSKKAYIKPGFLFTFLSVNSKPTGKLQLKGCSKMDGLWPQPHLLKVSGPRNGFAWPGTPIFFETPMSYSLQSSIDPNGFCCDRRLVPPQPTSKMQSGSHNQVGIGYSSTICIMIAIAMITFGINIVSAIPRNIDGNQIRR